MKVAKHAARVGAKIAAGVVSFVLVVLAPFADQFVGRIYFNHLCATRAGVRVYHTVALPAEYWDEQGRPKFLEQNGDLSKKILGARFSEPAKSEPYLNALGIDKYRQEVVDTTNQQVLGEVVNFMFWGGWVMRNLTPSGPAAVDCRDLHGNNFWRDFNSRLFTMSNAAK